jgi:anti-sigma regulatory factor (Ser/Thr protein kinase)
MPASHVLTFPGTRAGFELAFGDLRRTLDGHTLHQRARYNCELVFEEVVTNIIKHGYADDRGHGIKVSLEVSGEAIVMGFEDDGVPFDPREHPPVNHSGSILDVSTGGRGLLLVRAAARRVDYQRTVDQRNRLTVTIGPK